LLRILLGGVPRTVDGLLGNDGTQSRYSLDNPMTVPPFDLAQAHRWFGIEFNNAAWELVESPSRTPAETERMLRLAQASFLHWEAVGTPANQQRSLTLLSLAHAVAGLGARAVDLAKQCIELGELHDDLLTQFDRAAEASCMAVGLRSNRMPDDALPWEKKAKALAVTLDDDDRSVIQRLLTLSE
jgi:hypothetical protein